MRSAATSVFVWGIYEFFVGFTLLLVPNVFLDLIGQPATDEPWIRLAGVIALAVGYLFVRGALANARAFFAWTVHVRVGVGVLFAVLAVSSVGPTILLAIAVADWLGATWTAWALRQGTADA